LIAFAKADKTLQSKVHYRENTFSFNFTSFALYSYNPDRLE